MFLQIITFWKSSSCYNNMWVIIWCLSVSYMLYFLILQASDAAQRKQSTYAPPTMKGKNTSISILLSCDFTTYEQCLIIYALCKESGRNLFPPEERIMRRIYVVHLRSLCNLMFEEFLQLITVKRLLNWENGDKGQANIWVTISARTNKATTLTFKVQTKSILQRWHESESFYLLKSAA